MKRRSSLAFSAKRLDLPPYLNNPSDLATEKACHSNRRLVSHIVPGARSAGRRALFQVDLNLWGRAAGCTQCNAKYAEYRNWDSGAISLFPFRDRSFNCDGMNIKLAVQPESSAVPTIFRLLKPSQVDSTSLPRQTSCTHPPLSWPSRRLPTRPPTRLPSHSTVRPTHGVAATATSTPLPAASTHRSVSSNRCSPW